MGPWLQQRLYNLVWNRNQIRNNKLHALLCMKTYIERKCLVYYIYTAILIIKKLPWILTPTERPRKRWIRYNAKFLQFALAIQPHQSHWLNMRKCCCLKRQANNLSALCAAVFYINNNIHQMFCNYTINVLLMLINCQLNVLPMSRNGLAPVNDAISTKYQTR